MKRTSMISMYFFRSNITYPQHLRVQQKTIEMWASRLVADTVLLSEGKYVSAILFNLVGNVTFVFIVKYVWAYQTCSVRI